MLQNIIRQQIARDGFITVADYMNLCLLHPEYGYYTTQTVFGAQGDFTTAPEISQLFGETIGIWAALQWERLGKPSVFNLVELGPGRGILMKDLLRAISQMAGFTQGMHVHFVEASKALRDAQKQAVADFDVSVAWHDSIDTIDFSVPTIIIANEFFDALPIQQFVIHKKNWHERVIVTDGDDFTWSINPQANSGEFLPNTMYLAEDIMCEYSGKTVLVFQSLCEQIKRSRGAMLTIDYGDHTVNRFGDTLQAVKQHDYTDILTDCGQADLTAHVDFYQLDEIATNAGLDTDFTTQGDFLKQYGISERLQVLLSGDAMTTQKNALVFGYQRLIDPDQMGELFKVLQVTAG